MSTKQTTVLVADDHPLMLQAITGLLAKIPFVEIVKTAQNGAEALHFINVFKPDIAILDVDMPLMDGLEVIKSAKQSRLETRFIILTFHKEIAMAKKALELGVMGYLLKEDSSVEITECLEYVRHGKQYISHAIQELLKANIASPTDSLTDTEKKIVVLISKGMSSQGIAELLFVSNKTIENHRSNICRKLNLDGRHNSLFKWAMENKDNL
ncbi:MAG TPA: response regulator transcription factor [Saprospiraceae bacterium]|nr:response regulator transcription factor [Saprospiraceae bacterium]